MPSYLFARVGKPRETTDRFYSMNEAPSIGAVIVDEGGVSWKRVVTKPQASFDTKVDAYSAKDFAKATNKKGSIGDLWDRSAELSAKRTDKDGEDIVENRFFENYSKKRHGKKHPRQARAEASKALKSKGISIDWGSDSL